MVLTIGGGLASIVIWELVKTFGPDWLYDRITKFRREIRFRNKMYPVLVVKSFEATLLVDRYFDDRTFLFTVFS